MHFTPSPALTFGLELELQIVDVHTGMLSPSSLSIWPELQASPQAGNYALEATRATIEINSSVQTQSDALAAEVVTLVQTLRDVAVSKGLDVRGGGTQLTQFWNERVLTPTPRAQELEARFGFLPKRFSTYGMHVHIGVPDGDTALRLAAVLQALVPVFIALSAASPFLQWQDTGFCASRPLEPLVYPHGGAMPRVGSWAEFEEMVEALYTTGLAFSLKDIYWDVRPKPEYGTVEVRVFDTPLSAHKAVALAAFTRGCAALALDGRLRLEDAAPHAASAERASRFLACRDGLDAQLYDPFTERWSSAREQVDHLFTLLERHPVCAEDARHITALRTLCQGPQDATRMREAQSRWPLIGADEDAKARDLPRYSAQMCELLLAPLG